MLFTQYYVVKEALSHMKDNSSLKPTYELAVKKHYDLIKQIYQQSNPENPNPPIRLTTEGRRNIQRWIALEANFYLSRSDDPSDIPQTAVSSGKYEYTNLIPQAAFAELYDIKKEGTINPAILQGVAQTPSDLSIQMRAVNAEFVRQGSRKLDKNQTLMLATLLDNIGFHTTDKTSLGIVLPKRRAYLDGLIFKETLLERYLQNKQLCIYPIILMLLVLQQKMTSLTSTNPYIPI